MKIRTRILGGFMVTVLITIILGVTGFVSNHKMTKTANMQRGLESQNDSITIVLNAHYAWRQALVDAILTGEKFEGSLDPDACALGQWFSSGGAKDLSDHEVIRLLNELDEPHRHIHTEAAYTLELMQSGSAVEARDHLENVIFPDTARVISILTEVQRLNMIMVEESSDEMISLGRSVQTISVILTVVAIAAALILAFIIANSLSTPITPLSDFMHRAGTTGEIKIYPHDLEIIKKYSTRKDEIGQCIAGASSFVGHITNISKELGTIAGGDLTADVKPLSDKDEMGLSLKNMIDRLNHMFGDINASTSQVAAGSKQVADGAQSLAQGAQDQASSIEELSNSIAEIAKKTKGNAETAEKTARLAGAIIESAEKGSYQMDEMMAAVGEINHASQNISRVIKVIDDLAFQTNILALNAAVEAARAGQHGKGFAVVAEEVRNLASKSAEAAKETGEMIENSIEKAALGTQIAGETAASLTAIVEGINESSEFIMEIARASEEQSRGIDRIYGGLDHVTHIVQQNSATAQESAAASEEMSSQSVLLEELISHFKIRGAGQFGALPSMRKNFDYVVTE